MSRSLTIWCNVDFPPEAQALLERETAGHTLLWSEARLKTNLAAGPACGKMNDADIVFGQPDVKNLLAAERVKWVHLTSAGYTRFDNDTCRSALSGRGAALTNSSGVYDEPCAQHVAALVYAPARQLPMAIADQAGPRQWPGAAIRLRSTLLDGQKVLIYGYGAIASRLVELLDPLGLDIVGVRRTPR